MENFVFVTLKELKTSTFVCGLSVSITIIFEMPTFFYGKRLFEYLGTEYLTFISQIALIIRLIFYAFLSQG